MSGLNVILNTTFNNPLLPTLPVLGFHDTFNRADGPIGVTSGENKAWEHIAIAGSSGDYSLQVVSNAATPAGTGGAGIYAVDAGVADGTLAATFRTVTTDGGCRIFARTQDYNNSLVLHVNNASGGTVRLEKRVSGTGTNLGTSPAQGELAGKPIELDLAGTQATVKVGGVVVLGPYTVAELTTNTRHGFFTNGSLTKWVAEEMTFTPA